MFRALTCPSSGGQTVLSQHLVSSLSVNGCTVRRTRAENRTKELCIKLVTETNLYCGIFGCLKNAPDRHCDLQGCTLITNNVNN